ncbi:tRNA 2-selenouridine(34) synthase MnmH [Candidatus Epulonipiscium viviparus]|uniref:tRNA 2-selenouridine(34) synthase MnmH n=1 Tax=Candidatus Epulonipiscium viviparus TaxID=420336 RepID=UPI00016C0DE4|nr:tRNA 2-selenouridine(34) synthase MnmH [Candidatus Epulopiscium viviparus]
MARKTKRKKSENMQTTKNFKNIVINNTPLIDVRAEVEFNKGAFLNAVNIPIMDNLERHVIGIEYKQHGNDSAVELGHELVSGQLRETRICKWVDFINNNPTAIIYCFRGGQRSKIAQSWIEKRLGRQIERLEGGYKAFRHYLMENLQPQYAPQHIMILGGYTGTGKTKLLAEFSATVDLEKLANHRGSSFGRHIDPQPSQINFENNLAYAMIQNKYKNYKYMLLEDEGRHIGANFIPPDLAAHFANGKLIILQEDIETRVNITHSEYVIEAQKEYCDALDPDIGLYEWAKYIMSSIDRLKKRLGGLATQNLINSFNAAFSKQLIFGQTDMHKDWIKMLLIDYYDPMYKYQLKNTSKKIIFMGNTNEVRNFLKGEL